MSGLTQDGSADPVSAGVDPQRIQRLDRFLQRLVDSRQIPGFVVAVQRNGVLAHLGISGFADVEARRPVALDTLFRIYSMTKPVTAVAAMMLYEEGAFELSDPVSAYLPEFADMDVYVGGGPDRLVTRRASRPITIGQLLNHTAGLTYGFHRRDPVDELYRRAGYDIEAPARVSLADACEFWASLPLLFEPGQEWNYSVATDVVGRIVEVLSGKSFGDFLSAHIFDPLGMPDTDFTTQANKRDRLARLYGRDPAGGLAPLVDLEQTATRSPAGHFGGGGLVSTAVDYQRFIDMLLGGGAAHGVRLLGPRTVEFMHRNHLPGGRDLQTFGRPLYPDAPMPGIGFGLAGTVVIDPVRAGYPTTPGEYGWGGAASTFFWVDPREHLSVLFLTQLLPPSILPIRPRIHQLVHQALDG